MAKVKLSIGSARKAFMWDRSSFPFMTLKKVSDDTGWFRPGAFLKADSDGNIDAATVDGDEDDVIDLTHGFRLANNVPIKWKTVGGQNRTMLKLTDGDIFNIGNNDADGANEIRFDIEGVANIFKITPTGLFGNSYPFWADGAAGTDRDFYWSTSGVKRWRARAGSAAESGSNAGTNWHLDAFNDAGTLIDSPIDIVRASGGGMFLSRPLVGPATWTIGPSGNVDLLTLAAGSLTIDGDLIGDSSFQIGPSGDTDLLVLTSNLITSNGDLSVAGLTGTRTVTLNRGATTATDAVHFVWGTNGSARWRWRLDSQETGSNAGGRLVLQAFSDAGGYIDDVIAITRAAAGNFGVSRPFALNSTSTTADMLSSRATLNFFTANVTTFTALQAMTSGSIGATTGATRFRHDLHVGDGSGAQFFRLDGGAANRDFEVHNNASTRWRHRYDSSEDYRLYRSADGSSFSQVWYIDNSDGNGYLGTDPRWAWDAHGRLKNKTLDHDVTCYVFDDFCYADADPAASGGMVGWEVGESSGTVSIVDGGGNGIVRLQSGSPGGAYSRVLRGSRPNSVEVVRYNAYPIIFECRAKNNTTSTNGSLVVGLRGVGTGTYAYFYKDSTNSGNWICKSKKPLFSENSTNTSVASTSYHLLRIEIESSSSLKFYIDDVLVATHTTNLPDGNFLIEFESAYLTGNSTQGDLYVDYVKATWARA